MKWKRKQQNKKNRSKLNQTWCSIHTHSLIHPPTTHRQHPERESESKKMKLNNSQFIIF